LGEAKKEREGRNSLILLLLITLNIFHTSMKSMNKPKSKKCIHGIAFSGSAVVGERGQIVIPNEIRKEANIKPGDRIIFLGSAKGPIMLLKSDVLDKFLVHISKKVAELRKISK